MQRHEGQFGEAALHGLAATMTRTERDEMKMLIRCYGLDPAACAAQARPQSHYCSRCSRSCDFRRGSRAGSRPTRIFGGPSQSSPPDRSEEKPSEIKSLMRHTHDF